MLPSDNRRVNWGVGENSTDGVELLIDGLRPYAPEGERSEGEKGTERHA